MKRRLLASILSLVMVLSLLPVSALADVEGETESSGALDLSKGSIVITEAGYTQGEASEVAYIGDYTISQTNSSTATTNTITVTGGNHKITLNGVNVDVYEQTGKAACAFSIEGDSNVTLVLADGTTNSFTSGGSAISDFPVAGSQDWKNFTSYAGIAVNAGTSLTIEGLGTLKVYGDKKNAARVDAACAAIGANGTPSGNNWSTNSNGCGNITINGGTIIATNTHGAGIGGGKSAAKVTINGGDVTATGGDFGCGIGSCYQNTGAITIEINGGTVKAEAKGNASGIGGPIYKNNNCPVTITRGTVTAIGGGTGAGIGSGGSTGTSTPGNGGNITITGGTVIAKGGMTTTSYEDYIQGGAAGIGGGYASKSSNKTGAGMGNIVITGGTVIATGGPGAPGIGTSSNAVEPTNTYDIGSLKISGANVIAMAGEGYDTANDYAVKVLGKDTAKACGIGIGKNAPESLVNKLADWTIDTGDGAPMDIVTLTGQSGTVAITRNGQTWHSFTANDSGNIVLYCAEGYYKPESGDGFLVAGDEAKAAAEQLVTDLNNVNSSDADIVATITALDARYAAMSAAQQSYVDDKVDNGHTIAKLKEGLKNQTIKTTVTISCDGDDLDKNNVDVNYWQNGYNFGVPTKAPDNYTFDGWFVNDVRVTDDSGKSTANWPYLGNMTVTAHWRSEITGTGTAEDPYMIVSGSNMVALSHISNGVNTPEELALFSGAVNETDLLSKYFKLGSEITLKNGENVTETERYYSIVDFTGTFDGDGKTINLDIDTSSLAETEGNNIGKVNVEPSDLDAKYLQITGGLFTSVKGATLKNIVTKGSVKLLISGGSVGVMVGTTTGAVTISDCTNNANLTEGSTNNTNWAAGLVGQVDDNRSTGTTKFINCTNNGAITAGVVGTSLGNSCAAGIASLIFAKNIEFENCSNTGTLTAKRATDVAERYSSAAGIAGLCYTTCDTLKMKDCTNSGTVKADAQRENTAYGLAGVSGSMSSVTLDNCSNSGKVSATGGTAFVLIGGRALDSVSMPKKVTYTNCKQILSANGNYPEYVFSNTKATVADGKTTLAVPIEKDSDNNFDAERFIEKNGEKVADLIAMDNSVVYNDFSHNDNALSNELPFSSWESAYNMRSAADYENFVKAIRGDETAQKAILGNKLMGSSAAVKSAALAKAYIKLGGSFTLSDAEVLGLGTPSELFTGHVDGNGYTVTYAIDASDLKDATAANVGFIGCADQAEIRNINFKGSIAVTTDPALNSNLYVGAVVARGSNMTVENCKVATTIAATLSPVEQKNDTAGVAYVGGIGGSLMDSVVTNSSFTGSAQADAPRQTRLGGIAGNFSGTIKDCEVVSENISGTISANPEQYLTNAAANSYVGGAFGYGSGTVENTTVCGNIYADSKLQNGLDSSNYSTLKYNAYAGGLIGWNDNNVTVNSGKSLTTVTATATNEKAVNAFAGKSASNKTVTVSGDSWYVKAASNDATIAGAKAIDTTVLTDKTFGNTVTMEVPEGVTMVSDLASLSGSTVSFIKAGSGEVKLAYNGQTFYTATITVTPKDISDNVTVTGVNSAYTSDDEAAKADIDVVYGSATLTKGTDYTVTQDKDNHKFTIAFTGNYSGSVKKDYEVKPEALAVTASDYTGTYDGKDHSIAVNAPDDATVKYGETDGTYNLDSSAKKNAGTYVIYWQATKESQTVTGSAVISIAKAPLTIKADDKSMYVNAKKPDFTYTVDGLVNGETLTIQPKLTCEADGKTVGTFDIVPSGTVVSSSNDNYEISYVSGTLTVRYPYAPVNPGSSVSVPATANGSVTVSPSTASKGTTVTVTTKPNEGYELGSLEVLDKNGNALALKDLGSGKYSFTMPDGKVTVNASFVKASVSTGFADVPANAYYADAVKWAVDKGVTNGLSANLFGPYEPCTRAQIVTFLWRAAGSPEPKTTTSKMTDLDPNAYYYKAVLWAIENGITAGMTDTTFAPNATCTRGQSVTFLYRALGKKASGSANFSDVATNAFYADAVNWAVESNVTNGTSATTFSPNADCTRAEIVTFLYRAYQGK